MFERKEDVRETREWLLSMLKFYSVYIHCMGKGQLEFYIDNCNVTLAGGKVINVSGGNTFYALKDSYCYDSPLEVLTKMKKGKVYDFRNEHRIIFWGKILPCWL